MPARDLPPVLICPPHPRDLRDRRILEGCETFFHRGEQRYAPTGAIAVVCPDELHDGAPHGGGFEYRTLYPSAALMREVAEEVAGRPLAHPPWFRSSVITLPELVRHAWSVSMRDCAPDARAGLDACEQDTRLSRPWRNARAPRCGRSR
jgi:hypothetical protein